MSRSSPRTPEGVDKSKALAITATALSLCHSHASHLTGQIIKVFPAISSTRGSIGKLSLPGTSVDFSPSAMRLKRNYKLSTFPVAVQWNEWHSSPPMQQGPVTESSVIVPTAVPRAEGHQRDFHSPPPSLLIHAQPYSASCDRLTSIHSKYPDLSKSTSSTCV